MDVVTDRDPSETQEWRDALGSVLAFEGPERARYLLEELVTEARRQGAPVPYSANTPYLNTIPPISGGAASGRPRDRAPDPLAHPLERDGDGRAREQGASELGGHIASFQSAATLYDVGFNHFWHGSDGQARRRSRLLPGPFLARLLRARVSGRPADRGADAELPPGSRRQGHLRPIRIRG